MPVHEHEMLTTVFIKNLPRALSGDRDDKVKEDGFLSHTELSHRGKKGNTQALMVQLGNRDKDKTGVSDPARKDFLGKVMRKTWLS